MSAVTGSASSQRAPAVPGFTAARSAQQWLTRAATTWVVVALVGQLLFSAYISVVYGTAAVTGETARWNQVMPRGYVPGDTTGNAAIMGHVLLAALILVGGALQLTPAIRRRVPALHRWVGRAYMMVVSVTALAGVYMVWWRGGAGDLSQHVAITLNAVILITCAALAWRTARARDYAAHRRWALRTWLAANGVFFFRLGLFLWLVINRGPVGFDPKTFSGPALTVLAFGVYVVGPLTLLQGYFVARARPGMWAPRMASAGLFGLALLTAAGVACVTLLLWVPVMRR